MDKAWHRIKAWFDDYWYYYKTPVIITFCSTVFILAFILTMVLRVEDDPRPYTGVYDYCIRCGACARRCPADAIDLENGKDHMKCMACVSASKSTLAPRYGCGLCQTGVPCETTIPDAVMRAAALGGGPAHA